MKHRNIVALCSVIFITFGCSSVPESESEQQATNNDGQHDKSTLESYNESMHSFNQGVQEWILAPIGTAIDFVVPDVIEDSVESMLENLSVPNSALNNALQGKFKAAGQDLGRFGINSTIGLLGIFDWASMMGIPQHDEDFGQTLAAYGVGSGPYVVLPVMGGMTPRDMAGAFVSYDVTKSLDKDQEKLIENLGYLPMFRGAAEREPMSYEEQKRMMQAMSECRAHDGEDSAKASCDIVCDEMISMMQADLDQVEDRTEKLEMVEMAGNMLPSYCKADFIVE